MWLAALALIFIVALAIWRLASNPGLLDSLGVVVLGCGAAIIGWGIKQRLYQSS